MELNKEITTSIEQGSVATENLTSAMSCDDSPVDSVDLRRNESMVDYDLTAQVEQVEKNGNIADEVCATSDSPNEDGTDVQMTGSTPMSLVHGYQTWEKQYTQGCLGKFSLNTLKATRQAWKCRILDYLGKDTLIKDVAVNDIEAFMDDVNYGGSANGTPMTYGGAMGIYQAGRRVFQYFVENGLVEQNTFALIDKSCLPEAPKKNGHKTSEVFEDDDAVKKVVEAMLNAEPIYSTVKAVLIIYLGYLLRRYPGEVIQLTWDDVDTLVNSQQLDAFSTKLLGNYRLFQSTMLSKKRMTNPQQFVFISDKMTKDRQSLQSGTEVASEWWKHHIRTAVDVEGIKKTTPLSLVGKKVSRAGLAVFNPDLDYPILGEITEPLPFGGHGGHRISPEERKNLRQRREQRRLAYMATKEVGK